MGLLDDFPDMLAQLQAMSLVHIGLAEDQLNGETTVGRIERHQSLAALAKPQSPSIVLAVEAPVFLMRIGLSNDLEHFFPCCTPGADGSRNLLRRRRMAFIGEYSHAHGCFVSFPNWLLCIWSSVLKVLRFS